MSYLFSLNCRVYDVYVRCIASNTFPLTLRNTKHIFATFLLQAITHRDKFRKRLRCANLTQFLDGIMLWTWWKSETIESVWIMWGKHAILFYIQIFTHFLEACLTSHTMCHNIRPPRLKPHIILDKKMHMWHAWCRCVVPVRKQSHDNVLQLFALASYVIHQSWQIVWLLWFAIHNC